MACNKHIRECNYPENTKLPKCCYNHLNIMMKDSIKIFNKNDLNYWLDWGSLLGLIRGGKLIPYDHDVDFGIFFKDFDKLKNLKKDFTDLGYDLCIQNCGVEFPRIFFSKTNRLFCDVWLWGSIGNNFKILKWNESQSKINVTPKNFFEKLSSIDYEGIPIKVPSDTERYLEFRYGAKWKIPDPYFYKDDQKYSSEIRLNQLKKMIKLL